MQFQVPQFIEVEDKIFGPLTLVQFIYLLGSAGIIVVLVLTMPSLFLAILLGTPVGALGFALAFTKINEQPFVDVLQSATQWFLGHKLYIWNKQDKPVTQASQESDSGDDILVPAIGDSKLRDLNWALDIKKEDAPPESFKPNT